MRGYCKGVTESSCLRSQPVTSKEALPRVLRQALLAVLVLRPDEPDRPLGRIWRCHEFAQRVENLLELGPRVAAEGVVAHGEGLSLLLQLVEPLGQLAVRGRELAQPHEGAHDVDRYL